MGGYTDYITTAAQMAQSSSQFGGQADDRRNAEAEAAEARQAQLQAQYDEQERRRHDLLETQMASQRARLAAAGIGAGGGSAGAVLQGMITRSAAEQAGDARLFGARSAAQSAETRARSSSGLDRMLTQYGGSLLDGYGGED